GAVRDDRPHAARGPDANGGGREAESLHGAVSQSLEPCSGWCAGGALAEEAGPQGDAAPRAQAAGGERAAEEGEPAPAGENRDDRPADDGGGRDPARPGADGAAQ